LAANPEHIVEDLNDVLEGEASADSLIRAAYATDASILQVTPSVVVWPESVEDVAAAVKYAHETQTPIHPRGAGTGVAGEALGPGIVLDFSRKLNRILRLDDASVRVEPGVTCGALADKLAVHRRMFPPDPWSAAACTIGGMIATDAAGPHSLRYGSTRDHVLQLKVVLNDGSIYEVGREPLAASDPSDRLAGLVTQTASVIEEYADVIPSEQPAWATKNGGYHLRGVLNHKTLDLPRLLVGSEGTLAIVVEAELATLPLPEHRGLLIASFPSLEAAIDAAVDVLEMQPTACEMVDRRLLAAARNASSKMREWTTEAAEAVLFIEHESIDVDLLTARLEASARRVVQFGGVPVAVFGEEEVADAWSLLGRATARLARFDADAPPVDFVENCAVPVARLGEFLRSVQAILQKRRTTAALSARAGLGLLRVRPLLDLRKPDQRALLPILSEEILSAAAALGGTVHAEHGAGLLRTPLMPASFPMLHHAFARIKGIFDPTNILNPGRIVGTSAGFPMELLRRQPEQTEHVVENPLAVPVMQFGWTLPIARDEAERCNGCGACRTNRPGVRMCPRFDALPTEIAAPRSKANLFRQIVEGQIADVSLADDEVRAAADYCVNCRMCKVECPSGVDVARLMAEAKAAHTAEHGLSRTNNFFANLHRWVEWASGKHRLANFLLARWSFRWIAEKMWGLSRKRRLPPLAGRDFLKRAADLGWTKRPEGNGKPRVAFFADSFVRFFDPGVGIASVKVLQKLGREVYVPPEQTESGMAAVHFGDIDHAREVLTKNLDILGELVRDGYEIVTAEPTAALVFRQDALWLNNGVDAKAVAERTYDFGEYLAMLHERGELPEATYQLPEIRVAYHEPCHQKALESKTPLIQAFSVLKGPTFSPVEAGCSGMAGAFGATAAGFKPSMAAGRKLFDRLDQPEVDVVTASCPACRVQVEQGVDKRAIAPARWFAWAYGVSDEPPPVFKPRRRRRKR
jgi:FAD/FMN-containing dehydrogenase/Fe-S oxidoreductase